MTLSEATASSAPHATNGDPAAPRLRLRKLVLSGFKSFADKTEFAFDRPIVGVVGPNGCGKSNVVDAIKWVLGEQSAKSLRGGAMLDVIFNGAAGRPAGASAEVTLIFDNPADANGGGRRLHLDADEVAVGRILLRDGTSHYKLNGKNARLRDVKDLFLDTGVGVDAYSVIEQGRVAQMLDANPSDRRGIFEEAAGVSRFKLQAKEASRKLERVEQNLLRLSDVVEELDRRLRSVKVAAGKARNYQELSARLDELRLRIALHEYHVLITRQSEQTAARESAAFEADDAAGDLRKAESDLAALRNDIERAAEAHRQAEYARVQTAAKIDQAAQQIAYAARQAQQIDEQEQRLQHDASEAERQRDENAAAVAEDEAALASATQTVERLSGEIEQKHAVHRDAQLRQAEAAKAIESAKAAVLSAMADVAAADRRLGGVDSQLKTALDRRSSLANRIETLEQDIAVVEEQRIALTTLRDELAATKGEHEAAIASQRAAAAELGERMSDIGEALATAREQRADLTSRRNVLSDLEARREGVGEGVAQVLRERDGRFSYVRGLVADLIRVDVEHAAIVEAALDGRDQWLVTNADFNEESAAKDIVDLPGRVSLVPLIAASESPVAASVADLVSCDEADRPLISHLLGNTAVVADVAEAMRLRREHANLRCVTKAGEIVEPDGTLRGGRTGGSAGLLSRRSELADVAKRLTDADAEIERLQADLSRSGEESKRVDQELNALRDRVYETNARQVEAAERLSTNEDRRATLDRELPAVRRELAELKETAEALETERTSLEAKRANAQRERERHEAVQAEKAEGQGELARGVAVAAEELTALRVASGQAQEQQIAARRSLDRHAARRRELAEQAERFGKATAELEQRRRELADEREQHEADLRRLESESNQAAERVSELLAKVKTLRESSVGLADAVDAARDRREAAEDAVRAADAQLAEIALRLENTTRRYQDEAELDVAAEYEQRRGEAGAFVEEDADWDAIASEVRDLRGRISRLGNVNTDAIGELEELESRRQNLGEQLEDLRTSKRQLTELIETLNKESGERFAETFETVRGHFHGLFRKLFGGGRADLHLQTEVTERRRNDDGEMTSVTRQVDPLEAGIEIVARPPGKQPVHLSQLSGGEKTMTCVALLMSIFKSKPSPFCVLDEVDAALDEANNARFNAIVEDFLGESQFIIITHSKTTMRIADVLYGVTMQEQGVSKKVAVRFDQVERDGRIDSAS